MIPTPSFRLSCLVIIVSILLFTWPITLTATAQQQTTTTTTTGGGTGAATTSSVTPSPPLTPQEQEQQIRLQNVIASTTLNLQETQKQIGGVVFTPRWSQPIWINANSVAVLLAYCLPGEFADAGQEILGGFGLEVLESYGVALPQGGFMAWMAVVGNEDIQNRRLPAALGVMCASDLNKPETRVLSPEKQQEINKINEQFVNIQNTQINDIDNIINVINTVTTTTTTTPATPPTPPGQNRTGGGAAGTTTLAAAPAQQQDTTPPTIVGIEDEVDEPISEQSRRVTYALRAQDNVDGTAKLEADGITVTQDNVGGNIAISCDKPSGSEFLIDDTILTCVATDQAGNAFSDSFILEATGSNGTANGTTGGGAAGTTTLASAPAQQQDTTPPTLIVPENIVVSATSAEGAVVTYTVTAQDDRDGTFTLEEDGITVTQDSASYASVAPGTMSGQTMTGQTQTGGTAQPPITVNIGISCNLPSSSIFPIGTSTVECSAKDAAGNAVTASFTVTVNGPTSPPTEPKDTTPPAISAGDYVVQATSGEGAVVEYTVTALDNVDGTAFTHVEDSHSSTQDNVGGAIGISCVPSSPSLFVVGETEVYCDAVDAAGNRETASFLVTVTQTFEDEDETAQVVEEASPPSEEGDEEEGETPEAVEPPPVIIDEEPPPPPAEEGEGEEGEGETSDE